MSDTKFTEGPWTIGAQRYIRPANATGASPVARIVEFMSEYRAEQDANANLIAAAPELYAALDEMLVEKVDYMLLNSLGNPEEQHSVKRARAALAKAQGTQPPEATDE